MTFHSPDNQPYILGKEIGKGGEGTVFEVQGNSLIVLKKYNDPLTPVQSDKLRQMVAMKNVAIEAYAAWPIALVLDESNAVCGFTMKKLTGFVPLHMIFSPMDRKNLFPDKGYNFLVHVARNLATAFYKLHEAGLVVGDVNEGNILISAAGIVSFIDCDSFQVKSPGHYFFCEVGVPRYTPPELLTKGSFENIVRTVNTDSFSLAILIFQLLFLGRHPFAGRNRFKADIDEETAIKQHEFAYSLHNTKKKLLPPNDSFEITNLTTDVIGNFHKAFETDNRPTPAEWVKALDLLLAEMVTCPVSRIHTYPGKMQECPWCRFRQKRGILYFLDDSYLKASTQLDDIEAFVNGFKLDKLQLQKWTGDTQHPELVATPIDRKLIIRRNAAIIVYLTSLVLFILLVPFAFLKAWIIVFYALIFFLYRSRRISNFPTRLSPELRKRRDEVVRLKTQLENLIFEYDYSPDFDIYEKGLGSLESLVNEFRQLPIEYQRLRKDAEFQVYDEQLHFYLRTFDLEWYTIPSIGSVKKTALQNAGVHTAADITQLKNIKVPGIGPKNYQLLLDWQRQMSTGFVFIPDDAKLFESWKQVDEELEKLKLQLESSIRKSYQSLTYLKINITNRRLVLDQRIDEVAKKYAQAKLDFQAYEKFIRIF